MMRTPLALLTLASLSVVPAMAQAPLPGRTSELLGLREWTLGMITDTLARYAPGSPIESQHCVGVLLGPLKFPEAAWIVYGRGEDGRTSDFTQILVVEPRDSSRIRLRAPLTDTVPLPPAWEDAHGLALQGLPAVSYLMRSPWLLADSSASNPLLQRSPIGVHLAAFVRTQRTTEGYALARDLIHRDARRPVRLLALLVVAAVPEDDRSWHAVVESLRDPDPLMRLIVPQLLRGLSESAARTVDWMPAADDIAAVLDGTNLWAFGPMVRTLNQTRVDPRLARKLLPDRAQFLLSAIGSQDGPTREQAQALLRRFAGRDLGDSESAWRAWIATL